MFNRNFIQCHFFLMQTNGHTFLVTHDNCSLLFDTDVPEAFETISVSVSLLQLPLLSIHEMTRCDTNCGNDTPKIFFVSTSSSVVSDVNWSKFKRKVDTGDSSSAFILSAPNIWWPIIFRLKFWTKSLDNIYFWGNLHLFFTPFYDNTRIRRKFSVRIIYTN